MGHGFHSHVSDCRQGGIVRITWLFANFPPLVSIATRGEKKNKQWFLFPKWGGTPCYFLIFLLSSDFSLSTIHFRDPLFRKPPNKWGWVNTY